MLPKYHIGDLHRCVLDIDYLCLLVKGLAFSKKVLLEMTSGSNAILKCIEELEDLGRPSSVAFLVIAGSRNLCVHTWSELFSQQERGGFFFSDELCYNVAAAGAVLNSGKFYYNILFIGNKSRELKNLISSSFFLEY